jgi:hypothetical protein
MSVVDQEHATLYKINKELHVDEHLVFGGTKVAVSQ